MYYLGFIVIYFVTFNDYVKPDEILFFIVYLIFVTLILLVYRYYNNRWEMLPHIPFIG